MKFEEFAVGEVFYLPITGDCLIYFLMQDDEVVYVGQTTKGLLRPLQHLYEKEFNRIAFINTPQSELTNSEDHFIIKYQPRYNVKLSREYKQITVAKLMVEDALNKKLTKKEFNEFLLREDDLGGCYKDRIEHLHDKSYLHEDTIEMLIEDILDE